MSTFFRQTAQAMIAKHIDRFPLLKLDQVIDWQPIEQYLNRQRTRYSGLTLNQYGVASPCRTICTVCGFVASS